MLIYVAGPYSNDPNQGVRKALAAGDLLLDYGYVPVIPHLCHFWDIASPKPYEDWMGYAFGLVKGCQALLRLEGPSPGADREVEYARSLGKPVFYSVTELYEWSKSLPPAS